ncbi:CCCH zinc finger protein [Aspergillus luchuensis]|uniref:CCCH zinc finger protein n=1 Tax=Aspergillus kawachii TaxID=1069201 RepID=A0A146F7N4_ASPKA|nr:CCCH zinc finger protein [Aspergillus luchuensis]
MLIAALGELRRIKSPQFRVALGHRPRCTAQPGSGVPAGLQGDRPGESRSVQGQGWGGTLSIQSQRQQARSKFSGRQQ